MTHTHNPNGVCFDTDHNPNGTQPSTKRMEGDESTMKQNNDNKETELEDIEEMIQYWTMHRDEAEKMVTSLLREKRSLQERMRINNDKKKQCNRYRL